MLPIASLVGRYAPNGPLYYTKRGRVPRSRHVPKLVDRPARFVSECAIVSAGVGTDKAHVLNAGCAISPALKQLPCFRLQRFRHFIPFRLLLVHRVFRTHPN